MSEDNDFIEINVKVKCPAAAQLIRLIEKRSNDGAKDYGFDSIIERVKDPRALVRDAMEEVIDQSIYIQAAILLYDQEDKEEIDDMDHITRAWRLNSRG